MSKLETQLWASADILRGKMDASEYKDYLLGLVFYKYLSDLQLREAYIEEHGKIKDLPSREEQFAVFENWSSEDKESLKDAMKRTIGYFIELENLFYWLRKKIENYSFQISDLQGAFVELSRQGEQFEGLFDDIDLTSSKLGSNPQQKKCDDF